MRYTLLLLTFFPTLLLFSQTAPPTNSQAPATFQSNVRVVLLDVIVTDSNGAPVTGLTQSDFRVFEDDKPQKIASFKEHNGAPITTVRSAADAAECLYELPRSRDCGLDQRAPDGLSEHANDGPTVRSPADHQVPENTSGGSTGRDLYSVIALADGPGVHQRLLAAPGSTE